jgi:drug/metabolite transporter (DMT)-like permease
MTEPGLIHLIAAADDLVIPPPYPRFTVPYPIAIGAVGAVTLTVLLVMASSRFDYTRGPLTISLLLIIAFCASIAFCLNYTIPQDPTTSAVVGALVTAIGAIVGYWFGKEKTPKE